MRARLRAFGVFVALSTTCLLSVLPTFGQANWMQVPNYIDVQGRMTTIDKSIVESLAAGRLTPAQANQFKAALEQIKAQDTAFRADGRLSMMERVKIIMDLDKLNTEIQSSLTDRKVAVTDVTGREAEIEKLIQESLLSGRLTNLEALGFKKTLADIRTKEQALRADGALNANDLLTLSMDLDKLSGNIEQSLRTRVVSDPGADAQKLEMQQRIGRLQASGRLAPQQAQLLSQQLSQIISKEEAFKLSGNMLDNEEKLTIALEMERLKIQLDQLDPQVPAYATVKTVDEQQAEITKAVADAKAANRLSAQAAAELEQELGRIEALEAMFLVDQRLTDSELTTLNRDLDSLKKRVGELSKVTAASVQERKSGLRKKISDAQAAGRIKPESLATDYSRELDRIEAKEQFYMADGSLNDTESLIIFNDIDALNAKVESSLSALPNVAQQRDEIEKKMNDALASGRIDPAKADEIRHELQRIGFLDNTFRNDNILDERETVALNREYTNLLAKLNSSMPALPDIDVLQADIQKRISDGQARGSLSAANASAMQKEFDRIAGVEASFRASDQALAEWEVMALKRDLDRLSSDIDRVAAASPATPGGSTGGGTVSADIQGHWAQQYISNLQQRGTIGGFPDGTFKPDQGITRSQFAAIAVKALGLPSGGREVEFKDLPKTHWAYKAICSASDAGLVGGFPDGSIRPEDKLTRAQALVILAKSLSKGSSDTAVLDKYKDGSGVPAWAAASVAKAASAGIIVNYPDPFSIRPADLATRAEVAALTYQTMANLGQKLPSIRTGLEASAN